MITKKQLEEKIYELQKEFHYITLTLREDFDRLDHKIDGLKKKQNTTDNFLSRLTRYCHENLCMNSACVAEREKKPTKIKVKATPGRPKKVEVRVKRGPGCPRKNIQPRTKDGKFAKKK